MIAGLVVISVDSNSDQLGMLTVYPKVNMDAALGPAGPGGYLIANVAELARQQ